MAPQRALRVCLATVFQSQQFLQLCSTAQYLCKYAFSLVILIYLLLLKEVNEEQHVLGMLM